MKKYWRQNKRKFRRGVVSAPAQKISNLALELQLITLILDFRYSILDLLES